MAFIVPPLEAQGFVAVVGWLEAQPADEAVCVVFLERLRFASVDQPELVSGVVLWLLQVATSAVHNNRVLYEGAAYHVSSSLKIIAAHTIPLALMRVNF